MDGENSTSDTESSRKPEPGDRRADGMMYCCDTLGWVHPELAFEHRWDTSRPLDEYLTERAHVWEGFEPGK